MSEIHLGNIENLDEELIKEFHTKNRPGFKVLRIDRYRNAVPCCGGLGTIVLCTRWDNGSGEVDILYDGENFKIKDGPIIDIPETLEFLKFQIRRYCYKLKNEVDNLNALLTCL